MRKISIFMALILVIGCVGCGKDEREQSTETIISKEKDTVEETNAEEEQTASIANPWKYDVSYDDVKNTVNTEFVIPEEAYDIEYGILEEEKLVEIKFTIAEKRFCLRMKPTKDFEDISGLYYEWDAEGVEDFNGASAETRQYFAENISNILWHDGNTMYSLYTADGDKEGYEVVDIAKIIYGIDEIPDYDMYGYVQDKLPKDKYYNHYNVKGDNDEIYICNYNGDDELDPGTYVGMWQIGDGWTLEVIGEDEGNTDDAAVIKDENGVTVTDMEITINTPTTCYFDFTLNNSTGKDLNFDQNKIKLENYDGTELLPFSENQAPLDASAQVERHSFEMERGNIENGDEISVYYDGHYVTSISVNGGPRESK